MYNGKRVIVSMTSWERRIKGDTPILFTALDSLVGQECLDEIVLNLSVEEFPNKHRDLPKQIKDYKNLNVYFVNGNTKAFKKLIPTLNQPKYQDCIVFTCDDDVVYPNGIIKEALSNYHIGYAPTCFNVPPTHNWGNGKLSIYEYKYFGKALNLFERQEIWQTNNDDVAYGFLMLLNGYKYTHKHLSMFENVRNLDYKNDLHNNNGYNIMQDYMFMEKYIMNRFGLVVGELVRNEKGMFAVKYDYEHRENNDKTNKLNE